MSPNPVELAEEQLVARAQRGDADAFGDLYERHLNAIYRYVFYRVGDVAEAEDLTEVVFLKAWEALDSYEVREVPFAAWLYRIAHNAIVDRHRKHRETLSLDAYWPLHDETAGPEDRLDARERLEALTDALSKLAPDHQQVLALRFISGLSHAEASRVLNRTEEAVRVLQHRALNALRKLLDEKTVTRR
jgi:RNA polymerase sigma-70 factor (ECF subfamily)